MSLRIALLSSHNLDLLPPALGEALASEGLEASFHVSPFGQYRQEILAGGSGLHAFDPTTVLILADFADLFADLVRHPFRADRATGRARADAELAELTACIDRLRTDLPRATIVVATLAAPPRSPLRLLEHNSQLSLREVAERSNAGLRAFAAERQGVVLLDYDGLVAWTGYRDWYDERLWVLGRMRLSQVATAALASELSTLIRATVRSAKKCLVLDLDGTLWGGVIGEGAGEIALGTEGLGLAYRRFQEELLNLHERGVLLAIASKNNWDDAVQVIDRHPGMVLRRSHFAALRISWDDKATSLREIARELDLGLGSFVFVDDDPVERDWVASQLPEVQVLSLGDEPALRSRALIESGAFATLSLTDEDRIRPALYERRARAEEMRRSTPSLEDFYAALRMRVEVTEPDPYLVPRVAQLTQKTNQFNLTTRRYRDADIGGFVASDTHRVYALSLTDRFGDHGLVGAAIIARAGADWTIDTLLLSCRVLGRTVENAFLAFLAGQAHAEGARRLIGEFLPTPKNAPARAVYAANGFGPLDDTGRLWALDLAAAPPGVPAYIELVKLVRERSAA